MSGADGFDDAFRFANNGARVAKDGSGLKRSTYVPPHRPAMVASRKERWSRRKRRRRFRRLYRPESRWGARVKRTTLILILVVSFLLLAYAFFLYK